MHTRTDAQGVLCRCATLLRCSDPVWWILTAMHLSSVRSCFLASQTRGEACGPLNHPRSLNRVLIFKGGSAAWHNALCLGNYFFSACVAFCSGHGWVALGGDRWRPLASLTHVERLWWVSDEGRAGCRGPALCLCDVLMWAGRIGDLKASLRLSAGATRTCSYNVIWLNIARSVFASSKSPSTQHE